MLSSVIFTKVEWLKKNYISLPRMLPVWKGYRCAVSKTNRYLNVIDLRAGGRKNGECKLRMTTSYGKQPISPSTTAD